MAAIMTFLMGVVLSGLVTFFERGLFAGFLSVWFERFWSTYLLAVPTVAVVGPIARYLVVLVERRFFCAGAGPTGSSVIWQHRMRSKDMQNDPAIRDRTANQHDQALSVEGPVMLVNLFTPKSGKADEFIRVQSSEYVRLRGRVEGHLGNRLGKAVDGSEQLVNVALFDSIENYNKWRSSALFADHMDVIRPLIETAAPGMYTVAYSFGDV